VDLEPSVLFCRIVLNEIGHNIFTSLQWVSRLLNRWADQLEYEHVHDIIIGS
jgi:hypothetical protein